MAIDVIIPTMQRQASASTQENKMGDITQNQLQLITPQARRAQNRIVKK